MNPNDPHDAARTARDGSGYSNREVYRDRLIPPAGKTP